MRRILLAAILVLGAGPALASGRNPQLPSSGIVIHVFGPEAGIPEQETPIPAAPASGIAAPGVTASAAPSAAATPSAYPEPQLGTILHQMFITGDPNRGPGFPTGRPKAY